MKQLCDTCSFPIISTMGRKVIFILLGLFLLNGMGGNSVHAATDPKPTFSFELNNVSVEEVLQYLEKHSSYRFVFKNGKALNVEIAHVQASDWTVENVLNFVLKGTGLSYEVKDDNLVVIMPVSQKTKEKVTVRGVVSDDQGLPLPGVNVWVMGTNVGTITNFNGEFALQVENSNDVVFQFTYIGFEVKQLNWKGETTLNVQLNKDATELDEIVVTGFQEISAERVTGSFVKVDNEQLEKFYVQDITSAIEGRVAGLSTYNGDLSIRGVGTFLTGKGTQPLVVIDGLPVEGDMDPDSDDTTTPLSYINPNDIESITVLKDAAALSIYGSRAANGVIVVTTKKAEDGQTQIDFSADYTITPRPDLGYMDYASTSDIIDYEINYLEGLEAYQADPLAYFEGLNNNVSSYSKVYDYFYQVAKGELTRGEAMSQIDKLRNNDYRQQYIDNALQTQLTQQYNMSFRKGVGKNNLNFSVNWRDNKQQVINNKNQRLNLYFKNQMKVTDWFTFSYGANALFDKQKNTTSEYGYTSNMPYEQIVDNEGNRAYQYLINKEKALWLDEQEGLYNMEFNILDELEQNFKTDNKQNLRAFMEAKVQPLNWMTVNTKFQYEKNIRDVSTYTEKDSYQMRYMYNQYAHIDDNGNVEAYIPDNGILQTYKNDQQHYTFRTQLDMAHTFANMHAVSGLLGFEARETTTLYENHILYGYDDQIMSSSTPDWESLGDGVPSSLYNVNYRLSNINSVFESTNRYVSYYANAAYTYDDRINLSGSFRVDQTNFFGTDPKYRYRPLWSVGAAWNISNEDFMQNIPWVNSLKLRTSYGINGNSDTNTYPILVASMRYSKDDGYVASISNPPNPLLRWEKNETTNVAADFALFDSRLTGTLEFYNRYSSDLLATKILDPSTGFASQRVNNGAMSNRGVEITLGYDWVRNRDWRVNTTVIAARNRNRVERADLDISKASDLILYPDSYYYEGVPYNAIYAYQYAGLSEDGFPSVYDEEGNIVSKTTISDPEALIYAGQLTPKWNGSFQLQLGYKGFDISTMIVVYTGHVMRNDVLNLYSYGLSSGNVHEDIVNSWTPENTDTDIPVIGDASISEEVRRQWKYADAHILDASFAKVRNIALSYQLPQHLAEKIKARGVRLRAQVNNPLSWVANDEGIDPESFDAQRGVRSLPQMPTYSFGLNLNF
ncbi:SusC/RagA family TonB-linked outer membrane protein [Limibacter armeniacum]|uniref:SusC/RagA family TonB-linked outer membrane protein n=1 Tax=Limibacter armeniacum TaxID=466084 RepID=UPI002FE68254